MSQWQREATAMAHLLSVEQLLATGKVGDWAFDLPEQDIYLRVPDGKDYPAGFEPMGTPVRIPYAKDAPHPRWDWDGSFDAPTLHPSINVVNIWHGWLRRGVLEPAN